MGKEAGAPPRAGDRAALVDLIAVDWGSSQLRITALDSQGQAIEASSSPDGILLVPRDQQIRRLLDALEPYRHRWPDAPIVAAGMIGSRNGLTETTPMSVPVGLHTIALGIETVTIGDTAVHVLPGLVDESANPPDLIRGEEAQILGWLATQPSKLVSQAPEAVVVLPGTHSKWVRVIDDGIGHFRTFLTGEIYARLLDMPSWRGRTDDHRPAPPCREGRYPRTHTSRDARPPAPSGGEVNRWFREGVEQGLSGQGLLHDLFGVRSRNLVTNGEFGVAEYLSGLLIGSEIAEARQRRLVPASGRTVLIGGQHLRSRYLAALDTAGIVVDVVERDVFGAGVHVAYRTYTE